MEHPSLAATSRLATRPVLSELLNCLSWHRMTKGDYSAYQCLSIIAVHGLGANPDFAWLRKKDPLRGMAKDVNWLRDLLPTTLLRYEPSLRARIFCYNYKSKYVGKNLSKQRLTTVADEMLDSINNERTKVVC